MPPHRAERRVLLVTGGTSGVGLACCRALVHRPNVHLLLLGPHAARVASTVAVLTAEAAAATTVEGRCVDLASLAAVRHLVNELIAEKTQLHALVCNAACALPAEATTAEGFETTFATNYLGHFLLASALFHGGAFRAGDARMVLVISHVHTAQRYGYGYGDGDGAVSMDWEEVATDGSRPPHAAYVTSKACIALFGREFQRRYGEELEVVLYAPGAVPQTRLFRREGIKWRWMRVWLRVASLWDRELRGECSTPKRSGRFLARLASGEVKVGGGKVVLVDQVVPEMQSQRGEREKACQLWEHSMRWIQT